MDIGKTKIDILEIIADYESPELHQTDIKDILGLNSKSTVSQHLKELDEKGLIERVERPGNLPTAKGLTRDGFQILWEAPGHNEPNSQGNQGDVFLHKFFLKFKISNLEELDEGWQERWCTGKQVKKRYMPDAGAYAYFREDWKFRVTSEHVLVHLSELRGQDATHLKNRALVEAFQAIDWLTDESPLEVIREPRETEIWVNQAEAGVIAHPFALLVDQYSDMKLSDVKVYDSSGKERYKLDSSHGPELEAGAREFHEEDIQLEIDRLKHQAENPERHRWIYEEMPEQVEALEQEVEALEKRLDEVEGSQSATISDELSVSSKWRDRWGNVMGYSRDLDAPVKLVDAQEI